jgi:2',3'-cyclic-nucleotide 2'-phosphodiesterase (5'-nucleotidase family)
MHSWQNGLFTNVLYLKFNKLTKELSKESSLIEGPIPICDKIYKHNKRCDIFQTSMDKKLIEFTFHSKKFETDKKIEKIFSGSIHELVLKAKSEFITTTQVTLTRNQKEDNPLGNYICDLIVKDTKSDFCVINQGALRATWPPGPIYTYDVFQMLPYDSKIAQFKLSGKDLKKIIATLQEGEKGFYATSGLKQKIDIQNSVKKLLNVTTIDDHEIQDEKIYMLSGIDFLFNGGDDWSKVQKYFTLPADLKVYGSFRDFMLKKFKEEGEITEKKIGLMPRLTIA